MTYAPPSYPMQYGYPPTSVGRTARWAGILWLIMGIVTLLMGGCFSGVGVMWTELQKSPAFQQNAEWQRLSQEMQNAGFDLRYLFFVFGGLLLVYALITIIIGIWLIASKTKAASITGLIFDGLFLFILLIFLAAQIVGGDILGSGMSLLLLALHILILIWLIKSLRESQPNLPNPYLYGGYNQPQPMQGYQYQNPPPPKQ